MAKIQAVQIGNQVIRARARVVRDVMSRETQAIVRDCIDSMRSNNLVGMAAPQIGKSVRIFVTEIRKTQTRKYLTETDELRVFINPRIIETSQSKAVGYEGCGSVALGALFGPVKRYKSIIVSARDARGKNLS